MKTESPIMLKISKTINESTNIKTFYFDYDLRALPGQFIILWLPRVDEKPFSVSYQDNKCFAITVACVGPFTEKLCHLNVGDVVGIRGPYGTNYELIGKNIILVGGGCGSASLAFLADYAKQKKFNVDFIVGARSKELILYENRFKESVGYCATTDDGSYGLKGFVTDALENLLKTKKIDCVYACGPEKMLKQVIAVRDNYGADCQLSLERYMKCGFGLCGQCVVDDLGIRICKEGPVLPKEIVKKIVEFGSYRRDASGRRVSL